MVKLTQGSFVMALTKEDLKQIKGVVTSVVEEKVEPRFAAVEKKIETEVESLARSTAEQFLVVFQRFNTIDQRFSAVDGRFDTVDERFSAIDQKFSAIDQRFDTVDERFSAIDQRFDAVDKALSEETNETDTIRDIVKDHGFRIAKLEHKTA